MFSSGNNDTKSGKENCEDCVSFYVENEANELSGPSAKAGAPQADKDSGKPPEMFHKNVFLAKSFNWNILFSYHEVFNECFLFLSKHTIRQNM